MRRAHWPQAFRAAFLCLQAGSSSSLHMPAACMLLDPGGAWLCVKQYNSVMLVNMLQLCCRSTSCQCAAHCGLHRVLQARGKLLCLAGSPGMYGFPAKWIAQVEVAGSTEACVSPLCSACVAREPARQGTRRSLLWGFLLRLPANLDIHATRVPDLFVPMSALPRRCMCRPAMSSQHCRHLFGSIFYLHLVSRYCPGPVSLRMFQFENGHFPAAGPASELVWLCASDSGSWPPVQPPPLLNSISYCPTMTVSLVLSVSSVLLVCAAAAMLNSGTAFAGFTEFGAAPQFTCSACRNLAVRMYLTLMLHVSRLQSRRFCQT